jgi:hypothetical protein
VIPVELLGQKVNLVVARLGSPGALLAATNPWPPNGPTILLPRSEVPPGTAPGNSLDVFVYLDSEDRPVATVRPPKLMLGAVAFLDVTDTAPFGAFVDWGLPKELLVPKAEQTREVRVGDRHPIGLYLDRTSRLAGTMRVSELLGTGGPFELDQWVHGEAWRKEPELGVFVIVEQRYLGLLPAQEPHSLQRGDAAQFRVTSILPDGKLDLSLRGHAHEEAGRDAQKILQVLSGPRAPAVGDRSDPELIRQCFGLSKKAFKRAVGHLLKQGAVRIGPEGFVVVTPQQR